MPEYTHEQLIELALRELDPAPNQEERCKKQVALALIRVAEQTAAGEAGTKANRKLLEQMVKTGKSLELLRGRVNLPPKLLPPDLQPWLDSIEEYLNRRRHRPRSKQVQYSQFHAARWAGALLLHYGHQPSRTRRSKTKRNPAGRWDRLTAILAGSPRESFFHSLPARSPTLAEMSPA